MCRRARTRIERGSLCPGTHLSTAQPDRRCSEGVPALPEVKISNFLPISFRGHSSVGVAGKNACPESSLRKPHARPSRGGALVPDPVEWRLPPTAFRRRGRARTPRTPGSAGWRSYGRLRCPPMTERRMGVVEYGRWRRISGRHKFQAEVENRESLPWIGEIFSRGPGLRELRVE